MPSLYPNYVDIDVSIYPCQFSHQYDQFMQPPPAQFVIEENESVNLSFRRTLLANIPWSVAGVCVCLLEVSSMSASRL